MLIGTNGIVTREEPAVNTTVERKSDESQDKCSDTSKDDGASSRRKDFSQSGVGRNVLTTSLGEGRDGRRVPGIPVNSSETSGLRPYTYQELGSKSVRFARNHARYSHGREIDADEEEHSRKSANHPNEHRITSCKEFYRRR